MGARSHDKLAVRWGRRAVSIPLYASLFALVWGLLPLWLLVAALFDVGSPQRTLWPRTRAVAVLALYFVSEIAGVVGALAVWLLYGGGLWSGPQRYLHANAALQRYFTDALWHGATWLFAMRWHVEGAQAVQGPAIILVRHTSPADTVLTAALLGNPRRLLLRYVLKKELLWDPCLDVVGHRLPNAFVQRSGNRLDAEVAAVASLAHGLGPRDGVLIYPEGTRFAPDKLAARIDRLRSKGLMDLADLARQYRHVLDPRPAGTLALLDAAPGVDVAIVAHAGLERAASLRGLLQGALVGREVRVRAWRIAAADIPQQGRDRWLFEQWGEVDRWVAAQLEAA